SQPVARLLVGSYIKGLAPPHRFTLTRERVAPGRYTFCCTFPVLPPRSTRGVGRWELPTTVSFGARTFLSPVRRDDESSRFAEQRPSSRLTEPCCHYTLGDDFRFPQQSLGSAGQPFGQSGR